MILVYLVKRIVVLVMQESLLMVLILSDKVILGLYQVNTLTQVLLEL